MIYVAKLTVYDTVAEEERTVLLCTVAGFATGPTSTPPHTEALGLIRKPAPVRREVVDKGLLTGPSAIASGDLVIANEGGTLDAFAHYAVDNRECVMMYADDESAIYPDDYTMLFNGVMEQAIYNDAEIVVMLRAVEYFALAPLQPETYAGTNVGSVGLEGSGANVQGRPKVLVFGRALNMTPIPVNPALLIDQWSADGVRDISAMYDGGGLLLADPAGDYADETELQTVQPAAGYYRKLKAGGYTRRGSSARLAITGDVWEGDWPEDRTTAQIFARLAVTYGGLDSGRLSAADLAAFDAVQPGLIGVDFKEPISVGDALDATIKGQGGVRFSDNAGVLRLKRLEAPSGTPVATFSDDGTDADGEIVAFALARFGDKDAGLPVWRVEVLGQPLSTTQAKDALLGQVGTERQARLAQKYLTRFAEDPSVLATYKGARVLTVETRLMCPIALQAEADRLLALLKVRRGRFEVTLRAPFSVLSAIDLYDVIALKRSRYTMTNRLCRVLGLELDPDAGELNATVWGEA